VLEDLWLEPEAIGGGHGRRLWGACGRVAQAGGASAMELDAEPNAIGLTGRGNEDDRAAGRDELGILH
jgi:hypothetical protein